MKELLEMQIQLIDRIKNKQDQHCNENDVKIEELISKVTSMKQSLQTEKRILESKNHDLSKHLDSIKELEAQKSKFHVENQSLESQRNKLKNRKRNVQDQELLDQGRKKLTLYKDLTRVRWDYENLKESVQGYVSNKKDYIRHFTYKSDDTNLTDQLWQEIYRSTVHMNSKDIHDKENIVQNQ